ncbi:MAG: hypothetical protein UY17_C0014G0009 [Candidatus Beckwithbacteria bacterium GW2011_GWC2_47_9]|uniref:Uncharacterized protein n=1 Tax=Candidatus Beckwithbacteria bacterium GW2011_GWC2_47_9 TaxID=1618373 RepID=A0A0G1U0G4_9BACT|nr:MAG: hypothetical protein UY17_C0014G0009 [Candidatus Beckwithbacteria bacterium GW2011_GWC2_47_9]
MLSCQFILLLVLLSIVDVVCQEKSFVGPAGFEPATPKV